MHEICLMVHEQQQTRRICTLATRIARRSLAACVRGVRGESVFHIARAHPVPIRICQQTRYTAIPDSGHRAMIQTYRPSVTLTLSFLLVETSKTSAQNMQ